MPIGLIPGALRGIFNVPSAISQEGVGGISTAFFNPQKVEGTRRIANAKEENLEEEQQIDGILAKAQGPQDLEDGFRLLKKLEDEAFMSGLASDEGAYDRVIKPVRERLVNKAWSFIGGKGTTAERASSALELGHRHNDPRYAGLGEGLSQVAGREAQAATAAAILARDTYGRDPNSPKNRSAEANADYAEKKNLGYQAPLDPRAPKPVGPPDVDRLERDVRAYTNPINQNNDPRMPPADLVDTLNARRAATGQPQQAFQPGPDGAPQSQSLFEQQTDYQYDDGVIERVKEGVPQVLQGLGYQPNQIQSILQQYPTQPAGAPPPSWGRYAPQPQPVPSGAAPAPSPGPGQPYQRPPQPQPTPAGAYAPQMPMLPGPDDVPPDAQAQQFAPRQGPGPQDVRESSAQRIRALMAQGLSEYDARRRTWQERHGLSGAPR